MPPVVYLLHGEDEFSIAQEIRKIENKLGDPASAIMNTTRLDGRSLSFEELENACRALPFMGSRRLVIVYNPLNRIDNNPELQEKFINLLNQLPESTGLLLVEYRSLAGDRSKQGKSKSQHWLVQWAAGAGERAYVRNYPAPKGRDMQGWIREQAKQAGGSFSGQAAAELAELVGDDTRLAYQEIVKLLTYADYNRPVEAEDVDALTALPGQANIFKMVDALGMQDGRLAISMLHRLLDDQDVQSIFLMVVRQFRLLLLAREVLDNNGMEADVAKLLRVHPFVADKISLQARRFSLATLEAVYRRLLEIDAAIKTGQTEGDVALDTFVAGFTTPAVTTSR